MSGHWDNKKGATRMTRKEHWGDRRRRRWDDIIGATCMTPSFSWIPVLGTGMTKKGLLG
ncbi:hypothetical protein [Wolbachia endosymbiont (group A) of Agelastica alni]|uniref:hypothetical protein n=1 Tax=Wolbachia endosymbiont (group A) of Agelastica alni TaxID=3066130 RepID=UPI003132C321